MAVPFVPVPKDVPQADDPQVESQDITEEDNKPEIPNIENNTAEENLGAPKVLTKITIYNREGNVIYYGPPINFKRKVKTQLGSSDIVRIRRVPRVTPPDISEVETDLLQDTPPTASRLQLEDSILHRSRSVPFIKASPRCYPDSQLGSIRNIPGFPLEVGSIVQVFLPQRKTQVGTVSFCSLYFRFKNHIRI